MKRFSSPLKLGLRLAQAACLAASAAPGANEAALTVTPATGSAGRYELIELTVSGIGDHDTPFNPAIVRLDAELTSPSGRKLIVPGFPMRATELVAGRTQRRYRPVGPWMWKVRFAGTEKGTYRGVVTATERGIARRSGRFELAVGPSNSKGFIRVAGGNPHAFEYDDGTQYVPIGHCLSWANGNDRAAVYAGWLDRMAANDCNFIRIWLGSRWCFGLEQDDAGTTTTPYAYNEDAAALMDAVLGMCRERGIAIKLCFGDNIRGYLHANGGSYHLPDAAAFLTNEEAAAQWKAMIRYCVARWGYSTSIFAWEQWNEMDDNFWDSGGIKKVEQWTDAMCRYTRSIDPWGHMTTNSTGSGKEQFGLYGLPSVDFAQYHNYGGARLQDKTQYEIYGPPVARLRRLGKPVLLAECGLVDDKWGPYPATLAGRGQAGGPKDTNGYAFHEALWVGFMAGGAGTGQHWWWDSMIAPWDLYPQYRPFARFVEDLQINKAPMPPVEAHVKPDHLRVFARGGKRGAIAWVVNRNDWWRPLVMEGKTPETVSGALVTLPGIGAGTYDLHIVDTWTGATIEERRLEVPSGQTHTDVLLPDFKIDVALKAMRR